MPWLLFQVGNVLLPCIVQFVMSDMVYQITNLKRTMAVAVALEYRLVHLKMANYAETCSVCLFYNKAKKKSEHEPKLQVDEKGDTESHTLSIWFSLNVKRPSFRSIHNKQTNSMAFSPQASYTD
jgi:hypothetical protein